jgi:hypothetical protein
LSVHHAWKKTGNIMPLCSDARSEKGEKGLGTANACIAAADALVG